MPTVAATPPEALGRARLETPWHAVPAAPALVTPPDPAQAPSSDTEAAEREADLALHLAEVEADLARHLPLSVRFERSQERSPDLETEIRPTLDKVFGTRPGSKPVYAVECRDRVCELRVDPDQEMDVWQRGLNEHNERFSMKSFSSLGPAYLRVSTPEEIDSSRYAKTVLAAIKRAPGVEECKRRFPAPGHVVLTCVLDPGRRLRIAMTGDLADKDLGVCLRPVIERALALAPPLPPNIRVMSDRIAIIESPADPPANTESQRDGEPRLARVRSAGAPR